MLRVAGCLIQDHDTRLVVIAVLVCLLATGTAMRMLDVRRTIDERRDGVRFGAAIVVFSSGLWTTHVISMLAFRPDLVLGLDIQSCLLSLGIAVASTGMGFGLWSDARGFAWRGSGGHGSAWRTVQSAGVLAVGTAAVPLTGLLSAMEPGWPYTVLITLGLTACCTTAAMTLLIRRHDRWAAIVLSLGIWLGHAVVVASLTVQGAGPMGIPVVGGARLLLTMLAAAVEVVAVGLALLAVAIGQRFSVRLARESERFRMLTDATLDGLIFERYGQIASVNRAMCALAETEAGGLIGRKLTELIPSIELRLSERGHPVEHSVQLQDARTIPVEVSWQNGPDAGGRVLAVRDLSRQKFAEHQLEHLARLDPLTGLLNREQFEQVLQHTLRGAAPNLAVFYIELDRFELVAETVGHRAAEQILVQTAQLLSSLKPEASVVARLSREAFAVIQALAGPAAEPTSLADRILGAVALPFHFDVQPVAMTASIGVAVYPQDAADAPTLLEGAMLALCQAKRDGAGQWRRFQANMDLLIQKKRSLTNDLRSALRQDQFSLNYQPIVETGTLGVVGYEALLRWDHPERGRIPPSDFIPLAEETGLIVAIGNWVLATACAEAVAWADPVVISVNLSPAQFIQPGIVDEVAKVLRQTGLPPHRLELEITESTLMDDTQNAVRILGALKALGVKLAMDDFGTGYSSLSYLRKFPFDKIKIDRSFINDATESTDAETIVQAIIAMSRSLRLRVTAEGVETRQQLAMLRALSCDFVQGYLLGYPRSASELDLRAVKTSQTTAAAPRLVTAVGVGMA